MMGRTVEEAVQKALDQLGVGREDVEVDVLDEGRGGILGIGAAEAKVRVELRHGDVLDLSKETLETLLRGMGVSATVDIPQTQSKEGENRGPAFNIDGEDAGLLIGRRGETLTALQFILNFLLSRKVKTRVNATIDVEGYRERRYESVRATANRLAERVASTGRIFTMEPMPARERRVVHVELSGHPRVTTESIGEGEGRKVTIVPKRGGHGRSARDREQGPRAGY